MSERSSLLPLVRKAFSYPRFLSIGSIHNVVEIRMDREDYEAIKALLNVPAKSEGTDD